MKKCMMKGGSHMGAKRGGKSRGMGKKEAGFSSNLGKSKMGKAGIEGPHK